MISNGEDISWVSNILGHKDNSMTLENLSYDLQRYIRYDIKDDKDDFKESEK